VKITIFLHVTSCTLAGRSLLLTPSPAWINVHGEKVPLKYRYSMYVPCMYVCIMYVCMQVCAA